MKEAVEVVRGKQRPDGRWLLDRVYPGRVHFDLEDVGMPSRWNTLRALRMLSWWDGTDRSRFASLRRVHLHLGLEDPLDRCARHLLVELDLKGVLEDLVALVFESGAVLVRGSAPKPTLTCFL